jgi:hypothetical protein
MAACQLLHQGLKSPQAIGHAGQQGQAIFAYVKQKDILTPSKVLDVLDWLELDGRSH